MDLKNTDISKTARIYFRVSTDEQNLERQHQLIERAKAQGFYIAGIYSEKASGVNPDRSELRRLINDLQSGDWVIAESIDRITRLPPAEAERLIDEITAKGAKIQVPEIFDFEELGVFFEQDGSLPGYLLQPLLAALQKMFLRIALNMSHQDWAVRKRRQKEGIALAKRRGGYRGRQPDKSLHEKIIKLRLQGFSITQTAQTLGCSVSTVNRVSRQHKKRTGTLDENQPSIFRQPVTKIDKGQTE
jgi:resolvase